MTIEEFYDLMHHTHSISDLVGGSDVVEGDIQATVLNLVNTVNELKQTIEDQKNIINELTIKSKEQEETINQVSQQVEDNKNKIDGTTENGIDIIDWDIEKEGIQDLDGNTIG
jgi:chromosome condensin MukBEF ATPase and DNA-binding subunit MukB